MSMSCITTGCKKPAHKAENRYCADHAIEFLQRQLKHAETRINGLPLRDYFAGQALAGISSIAVEGFSLSPHDEAEWAYQRADAMLIARKEQPHD